jgi:NADH-quinone oxidoreductase subunit A
MNLEITGFGVVLLFIIGGLLFILVTLFVGKILRPNRPNEEKLTTYESGEDPVGSAWGQFNIRFYIIALVFILFEVELIFLFPWATVFGDKELLAETNGVWGWFSLIEIALFVGVLALGLAYVWKKGHLDWVKPKIQKSSFKGAVPKEVYEKLNNRVK